MDITWSTVCYLGQDIFKNNFKLSICFAFPSNNMYLCILSLRLSEVRRCLVRSSITAQGQMWRHVDTLTAVPLVIDFHRGRHNSKGQRDIGVKGWRWEREIRPSNRGGKYIAPENRDTLTRGVEGEPFSYTTHTIFTPMYICRCCSMMQTKVLFSNH